MKPLKYEQVRALLPELDELRPVLDALLASSTPDPKDRWTGSGEVRTEESRIVHTSSIEDEARRVASEEAGHLTALYTGVAEALQRTARGDGAGALEALLEVASLEENRGRFDRARRYAKSAYELARNGHSKQASKALRRWGRYAKAVGDHAEAMDRYEKGFEIAVAINDAVGAAEAAIGVGNVLEQQGLWEDAERWYLDALAQLPDPSEELLLQHWQAKLNIHIVLRSRGNAAESEAWLVEASQEAEAQLGDAASAAFHNAWGQLFMWRSDFSKAERSFRVGLEEADDPRSGVTIRLNLAEALLAQGRVLEAAEQAREAEREALRGSVGARLPEVYRLLGRAAATEGNSSAFVLFERALEICRERGLPDLERALTLQAYGESEESLGNEETAADLLAEAERIYDSHGIEGRRHAWSDVHQRVHQSEADSPSSASNGNDKGGHHE